MDNDRTPFEPEKFEEVLKEREESSPPPEPAVASTEPAVAPTDPGTGIPWGAFIILFGVALIVAFTLQNTDPVPMRFLWLEGEFPLAIIVLVTVGVSFLLSWLAAAVYGRRRRRRRAEKRELRALRESKSSE